MKLNVINVFKWLLVLIRCHSADDVSKTLKSKIVNSVAILNMHSFSIKKQIYRNLYCIKKFLIRHFRFFIVGNRAFNDIREISYEFLFWWLFLFFRNWCFRTRNSHGTLNIEYITSNCSPQLIRAMCIKETIFHKWLYFH